MRIKVYRLAAWLVPRLPLSFLYRLAELVGDLLWLVARGVRENIAHNQRRALGRGATPCEVARSSRQVMRNLAKIYVDEFRVPALSNEALREMITIHGLEQLEAARVSGRGVILTSAHFGAPQLVGQLLTALGYPTTVVVEHVQPEELFEFMCELRSSRGIRLVPIDASLIPLIRTLRKENGVVGLVVDRDISESGICMPFLGEETRMADGAVRLALRTKAPIVVASCRRIGDSRYEATIQPPLELPTDVEDSEEAVRVGTERLVARLESFIRETPEQWVMSVPLWQTACQEEEQAEESSAGVVARSVKE